MDKKKLLSSLVLMFCVLSVNFMFNNFVQGQIQYEYDIEAAFPNLIFNQPVGVSFANDNTSRLFVVEQIGVIKVFDRIDASDQEVFLDITERVLFGGEQGLLGLAFHPNYLLNGYFYVNYVANDPTRTIIARYSVDSANPNRADRNSEVIILEIAQPFSNHNGGQIAFGPDGYLYIGTGDGGSQGDPFGNGQNLSTLLGKILRINIDAVSEMQTYSIPPDNPYVNNTLGYREEIFAYGLRNPWRFSFDITTGQIWAGDVGQSQLEEINIIEKGKNYGWNIMEGTQCYNDAIECDKTGLELPIYEYNHSLGNAIVGGFIYRGTQLTELYGKYIYGDYGSGLIWALSTNNFDVKNNTLLVTSGLILSSFGVDQNNELLICALDGKIYRLTSIVIPEFSTGIIIVLICVASILLIIFIKRLFSLQSSHFPVQGNL
jgi:glucose/arabinose dehydrogenase